MSSLATDSVTGEEVASKMSPLAKGSEPGNEYNALNQGNKITKTEPRKNIYSDVEKRNKVNMKRIEKDKLKTMIDFPTVIMSPS